MKLEGCDRKHTFLYISLVSKAKRDEFTTDIRPITNFFDSIMAADQYTVGP